jgi:flagellar L-ring protein precursor FlgH
MRNLYDTVKLTTLLTFALFMLTACGASERLARVGKPPEMTKIENPQLKEDYTPISMPMPMPQENKKQPNSLWGSDRQAFFKDQRASDVGDILTVLVNIDDEAEIENETERSRDASEDADLPGFLGYEQALNRVLPEAVSPSGLVDFGNQSNHSGRGTIEREEEIELKLAALVTQILPNGNFAIHGRQEVLVNYEKRIIQVDGVIRPEDISTQNTINSDQIAEARIVYAGEGQISDVQQPRYGQQVYDILFPF